MAYVRFTFADPSRSRRAEAARATGFLGCAPEMRRFLDDMPGAQEPRGFAELAPIRIADFCASVTPAGMTLRIAPG